MSSFVDLHFSNSLHKINPTKFPASGAGNSAKPRLKSGDCAKTHGRMSACFCSQSSREISILLLTKYLQLCDLGRAVRFVTLALKVIIQNDGDFVDVICYRLPVSYSSRSIPLFSMATWLLTSVGILPVSVMCL